MQTEWWLSVGSVGVVGVLAAVYSLVRARRIHRLKDLRNQGFEQRRNEARSEYLHAVDYAQAPAPWRAD